MPKKNKFEDFDDPFDVDLLGDSDLELSDLDLLEPAAPPERPSAPRPRPSASEVVFRAMQGGSPTERPLQGNYQYVNLLLPATIAARIEQMARAHKMMLQPFVRWMVDQMALLYEEGARPADWRDEAKEKKRVPALIAPMMADLLRSWAQENRIKFQPFLRWLATEFMDVYQQGELQPLEPEEFIPDEAVLFHWASLTVEKYRGTGKQKK